MKLIHLHSITEIKSSDCFATNGSRPVKVFCNDLNYYVCKYNTVTEFPNALFNEYIAASFLKIWDLPVPDFAIVKIKPEHILSIGFPFRYFEQPCFGSRYYGEYPEVDKFFIENPAIKREGDARLDSFLKIGLFDIWLCNEDRHHDNYNLLFKTDKGIFVPIDHVCCFNSNNLDKEPYIINEHESILTTPLLKRFFSRTLRRNPNNVRLKIIDEFKRDVQYCHENLDEILAQLPSDWNSDIQYLQSRLSFFFSDEWINSCIEKFTELFALNIKIK